MRPLRPARPWVLVALALLLAVPVPATPATAARASVEIEFGDLGAVPPGGQAVVPGTLVYRYDTPTRNATPVTLTPTGAPPWLLVSVNPASLQVDASRPEGRTEVPVRVTLGVVAGTEALSRGSVDVVARARANEPLEAAVGVASLVARVSFDGDVALRPVEEAPRVSPGEPVEVRVRVTNDANGPARVVLDVLGAPEDMQVVTPSPFIVEPEGALRERTVTVGLLAARPGTFPLMLRGQVAHAFDPSQRTDPAEAVVTLTVEEANTPGPGGPFLLAALLGAACLAARRRPGRRGGLG